MNLNVPNPYKDSYKSTNQTLTETLGTPQNVGDQGIDRNLNHSCFGYGSVFKQTFKIGNRLYV